MASGTCMSISATATGDLSRCRYLARPARVRIRWLPLVVYVKGRRGRGPGSAGRGAVAVTVTLMPMPDLVLEVFGTGSWSTSEVDFRAACHDCSFFSGVRNKYSPSATR